MCHGVFSMASTLSVIFAFLTVACTSLTIGVSSQNLKQARADVCPAGFYGKSCSNVCPAVCPKSCDRNGSCTDCLESGVQLPECVKNCSKGFFGRNCVSRCSMNCSNSMCHPQSGHCYSCKMSGRQLPSCKVRCLRGTYGHHCVQKCPGSCRRACNPVSGDCLLCLAGEGPKCTVNCALSENEEACKTFCPRRCVSWCNTSNGQCSYCTPGYMSPSCAEHCQQGYHGGGCAQRCSPRCRDSICDPLMGFCNACQDGYVGPTCNGQCIAGFYGFRCSYTCPETCSQGLCNFEDGQCYHCRAGYTGRFCDQLCENGTFGKNCSETCPESCDKKCDPVTGKCSQCGLGIVGDFCNQTCPLGYYGRMCANECAPACGDSSCDSVTGECLPNISASKRERGATYHGQIIFFATLALIIPIIIICSAVDVFRRIEKKRRTKAKAAMDAELARLMSEIKRFHEREDKECEQERRMDKLQRLKEECRTKAASNEPVLNGYRRMEDDDMLSPHVMKSFRRAEFESLSNKSADSGKKNLERPVHPPRDEMRFEDAGRKRPVAVLKCQPEIAVKTNVMDKVRDSSVGPHIPQKQSSHNADFLEKVPTSSTPQSKGVPFEQTVRKHALPAGEKSRPEEVVDGQLSALQRGHGGSWEGRESEVVRGVQLKSDTELILVARGLRSPPERQIASSEPLNPDPAALHDMAGHISKLPFQKSSHSKAETRVPTSTLTSGKISANEIAISVTGSNIIALETDTVDQRKIRKGALSMEKNSNDLVEEPKDLLSAKKPQASSQDVLKTDYQRRLHTHDEKLTGKTVNDTKARSKSKSVRQEQRHTDVTGMKTDSRDPSFGMMSSEFSVQGQRGSPVEELSQDSTSDIKPHVKVSKHTKSDGQGRPSFTSSHSSSWPFRDATIDSLEPVSACSTEGNDLNPGYLGPRSSELLTSSPSHDATGAWPPQIGNAGGELVSSESNSVNSKKHDDPRVVYKKHYSNLPSVGKDDDVSAQHKEMLSNNSDERANAHQSLSPAGQNEDSSKTAPFPTHEPSSEEESSRCWINIPESDYASTVDFSKEANGMKNVVTLHSALSQTRLNHLNIDNTMPSLADSTATKLSKEAASAYSLDSFKKTKAFRKELRSASAGTKAVHSSSSSIKLKVTAPNSVNAFNNSPLPHTTSETSGRTKFEIATNISTTGTKHALQSFSPPVVFISNKSPSLGSAARLEIKKTSMLSPQSQVETTQPSSFSEKERPNTIVHQLEVSQICSQQTKSGEIPKQTSMTDQYASFIASMKQYTDSQARIPDWSPVVKPSALLKDGVSSSPSQSSSSTSVKSVVRKNLSPSTGKHRPKDLTKDPSLTSSGASGLSISDVNGPMVIRCATTRQILPQKSSSTKRANQKVASPMSLPIPPLNGRERLSPTPRLSPISKASDTSTEDEEGQRS